MNLGGPSPCLGDLLRCPEQGMLRALAHRQQGDRYCAVLVVMPHLQKPAGLVVGQEENTSTVLEESWKCGSEPLASVTTSYQTRLQVLLRKKIVVEYPDLHPTTEHTRKAPLVADVGVNPRAAVRVVCQADAEHFDTWAALLESVHSWRVRALPPLVSVRKNHSHNP